MKTVIVFFDAPGYDDYPFNHEEYRVAYQELADLLWERNARFGIAREQNTYKGNNTFAGGWLFDGKTFIRTEEDIKADVIYDKGHFSPDADAVLMNNQEMNDICVDKFRSYELFPQHHPMTRIVRSKDELDQALSGKDSIVVAKPINQEEGKGVIIAPAPEVVGKVTSYPYMLQDFIDTSGGVPGIVDGMHDFRCIVINGTIVVSYVRTPPPGEMRANVSRGGKEIPVPVENVPAEARAIVKDVDAVFSRYGTRVYSVDMGRDANGTWKIIELNSRPGLSPMSMGKDYEVYLHTLADVLSS